MKKHRRLVSLILTLTVLMLSIVSCGDLGEDLPDQNGTDDQNIETEGDSPDTENNTEKETESQPPVTTAVPETEKLPDETIAPEAPKDDPNPGQIPEMAIESGYTVTETANFNILVAEDKVKTSRTARVAALQNESGENALYLDVLTEDGQVMTSITWKGYYQMFVREDGLIVLMRL